MSGSEEEMSEVNHWHPLPAMIGDIINADPGTFVVCGGYIVSKDEDHDVRIYEELDVAATEDELELSGDQTFELGDEAVYAGTNLTNLRCPEGGWESETEELPADLWGGYE